MKVTLKLSEDAWQRKALAADLSFVVPAKVLVFAWMGCDLWWAKSSHWSTEHEWTARYLQAELGWSYVLVDCRGRPSSPDVPNDSRWHAWIPDCCIPVGHEPDAAAAAEVDFLKPAVFHQRAGHGVGLIAVPHGAAKSLRTGIWRLKQTQMNESLEPFATALFQTRTGRVKGFMPNITFHGTAYGSP